MCISIIISYAWPLITKKVLIFKNFNLKCMKYIESMCQKLPAGKTLIIVFSYLKCWECCWTSWAESGCPQSSLLRSPTPTEGARLRRTVPRWPQCTWPPTTSCRCQLHLLLLRPGSADSGPQPGPRWTTGGRREWGAQHTALSTRWTPPVGVPDKESLLSSLLVLGQKRVQRWSCRWWLWGCEARKRLDVVLQGRRPDERRSQERQPSPGGCSHLWRLCLRLTPRRWLQTELAPPRRSRSQHCRVEDRAVRREVAEKMCLNLNNICCKGTLGSAKINYLTHHVKI